MKKIILSHDGSVAPLMHYLGSAFERRGVDVIYFETGQHNTWMDRFIFHRINKLAHNLRLLPKSVNYFQDHPLTHRNFRSQQLKSLIDQFKPDLLFVIRGPELTKESIHAAPMRMAWWVEGDNRYQEIRPELPWFDHYFFINRTLSQQATSENFSASYLPHAVDPNFFYKAPVSAHFDLGFVGAWSAVRQHYIAEAIHSGYKVGIYGPRWRKHALGQLKFWQAIQGNHLPAHQLNNFYNQCKIVLNLSQWGPITTAERSGMTLRFFEVPATGRLLLTDTCIEQSELLQDGEQIATFRNIEEFRQKLRYYLEHAEERHAIAEKARTFMLNYRTYDTMAAEITRHYWQLKSQSSPH